MKRLIQFGGVVTALAGSIVSLQAVSVTFDLRDTGATAEIESGIITRGGVTATLVPFVEGSTGDLNQTNDGFGINEKESGDNTHELDGVNGVESISITFDQDVLFTELVLSDFGNDDKGTLTIGNFSPVDITSTGTTSFSTDNFVSTGQSVVLKYAEGNGFSFDEFTVDTQTVPDGWSGFDSVIFLSSLVGVFGWIRQKTLAADLV